MSFTKILCPVDFSECSQQALRFAIELAKDADGELAIAHARYTPVGALSGEYLIDATALQQMVDDEARLLDTAVREAIAGGARARPVLLSGSPGMAVAQELEAHPYDLAVVGTVGRTGLLRVLLGSIAEKILRHSPCSVLAVRPGNEPAPFRHLLVPVDFFDSSQVAVDQAAEIAKRSGAAITLLHVGELPVPYGGEPVIPAYAGELHRRSEELLEKWATRLRARVSTPVTARTRIGWAGGETLRALDADPTIDLVVIGSHGRTGLSRLVLGSVAEKVVRHARTPVLVARARQVA